MAMAVQHKVTPLCSIFLYIFFISESFLLFDMKYPFFLFFSTNKLGALKIRKMLLLSSLSLSFSKVIESLDDVQRSIIEKYGFACLLKFDKCFVPNKFAIWVARMIDYRSGDIILKDQVISITEETVSYILDLPIGGAPFPTDFTRGKSYVLSRFGRTTLPPLNFFGDLLTKQKDVRRRCKYQFAACLP